MWRAHDGPVERNFPAIRARIRGGEIRSRAPRAFGLVRARLYAIPAVAGMDKNAGEHGNFHPCTDEMRNATEQQEQPNHGRPSIPIRVTITNTVLFVKREIHAIFSMN
jgi:hypothetical protein